MLNFFNDYFNYYGYYNYNYYFNYIQRKQLYTPPVRQLRNSNNDSNNQKQRDQQPSRKAIEKANLKKGLGTKIEQGNKGYDLLLKMGYQEGQGLGKNGAGIMEPLGIVKKSDRKGLGTGVSSKTSEETKNCQEPTKLTRSQRRKIAKRLRQPKDAITANQDAQKARDQAVKEERRRQHKDTIIAKQEAQNARDQADKAMRAADKALEAANRAKIVADNMKAMRMKLMEVDNDSKLRRQHSPIRAPITPPPLPAVKTSTPKVTQKQTTVKASVQKTKENFSINDSCTRQFLLSLSRCFHSDIELMQLRLEAAASRNPRHAANELIVAKIVIGHNQTVAEHAFEFIRSDLVGWIGVYQENGMDTPIFHSMTNNQSHITVVCDNAYAYNCLEKCIVDISIMETMKSLKVVSLPPITPLIYCYDVIYEGIARDSTLFLTQLHLHKSKLYSDNWVVVSHEVCPEDRKTYFIFLIDERSALALNFHYSSNLFICMQKVTFRQRGLVTEEYIK